MTTNKMTAYAMVAAIVLIMVYYGAHIFAG